MAHDSLAVTIRIYTGVWQFSTAMLDAWSNGFGKTVKAGQTVQVRDMYSSYTHTTKEQYSTSDNTGGYAVTSTLKVHTPTRTLKGSAVKLGGVCFILQP